MRAVAETIWMIVASGRMMTIDETAIYGQDFLEGGLSSECGNHKIAFFLSCNVITNNALTFKVEDVEKRVVVENWRGRVRRPSGSSSLLPSISSVFDTCVHFKSSHFLGRSLVRRLSDFGSRTYPAEIVMYQVSSASDKAKLSSQCAHSDIVRVPDIILAWDCTYVTLG